MCGFLAILQDAPRITLETARAAAGRLTHRGPDGAGEWTEHHVMLFHRRLSIIDLATGQQPMVSRDGRYVIVFNGEIYNFERIRNDLRLEGIRFRTQSDTEVLLEGFGRWGVQVVDHLHGIFAFAVWDRLTQTVFGARDRLGIKPLAWAVSRGSMVLSSTLEPFDELQDVGRVDPVAVRDLLAFDYIPSPRSILQGVQKLEPGCSFQWSPGDEAPRIERYWAPPSADLNADAPSEKDLEELLQQVVRRQMISDVPVGVFLSGGIDSSLLVALMSRESEKPVRSFSIAFKDTAADESSIAGLVARQFGTDHTVLPAEEFGPDLLLDFLGSLDEPFADPAAVPTYALAKMTAGYVKVALSGDGGDEVFGGYPKYLLGDDQPAPTPGYHILDRSLRLSNWRPRGMSHLYWRMLSPEQRMRWSWVRYGDFPIFRKDLRQVLAAEHHKAVRVAEYFEPWERRARRYGDSINMDVLMRADLETYLSENCLVKTDRASMLASLEVRVPYLDELILDRILPLHANRKIVNSTLKALLMPIARRLLPRQVWDRPKHGFNVPLDTLLSSIWSPAFEAAIDWGEHHIGLFNYPYLRRLQAISRSERGVGRELWSPFVFLAWAMKRKVTL